MKLGSLFDGSGTAPLVAALYVCIGVCAVKYGIKPTALMVLALILMGVLEGII